MLENLLPIRKETIPTTLLPEPKRGIPTTPPDRRTGREPLEVMGQLPGIVAGQDTSCTSCSQAGCHTVGCPMDNNIPLINKHFDDAARLEFEASQFLDKHLSFMNWFGAAGSSLRNKVHNTFYKKRLKEAKEKRDEAPKHYRMAFDESWKTNRFGLITGLICPSKGSLCEASCIYTEDPIAIRGREYLIHQKAWQNDWIPPLEQKEKLGKSIAIIGSGPGALATAEYAFEAGYDVTIYERSSVPGGLTALGIPEHKMNYEKDVAQYYERLEKAGVKIVTNTSVGQEPTHQNTDNITLEELSKSTGKDGIVMATGKYRPTLPVKEEKGAEHVKQAIDFLSLASLNARIEKNPLGAFADDPTLSEKVKYYEAQGLNMKGKRVIVIGGSDTAADTCNVSAMRQGAQSVTHLYRGAEDRMKMDGKEKETALDAGVDFKYDVSVEHIEKNSDGSLSVTLTNREVLECDEIISATGFGAEDLRKSFGAALPINEYGLVDVQDPIFISGSVEKGDPTPQAGVVGLFNNGATQVPVYAVGDITGSPLAVHALAGGRDLVKEGHLVGDKAYKGNRANLPVFGMAA